MEPNLDLKRHIPVLEWGPSTCASRTERMKSSTIRELLKLTQQPGMISWRVACRLQTLPAARDRGSVPSHHPLRRRNGLAVRHYRGLRAAQGIPGDHGAKVLVSRRCQATSC